MNEKLTPDETELIYRIGPVMPVLVRMGISAPTNKPELDAFNELMGRVFGLSEIRDRFAPRRYLLVCEALGIRKISLHGFKALIN